MKKAKREAQAIVRESVGNLRQSIFDLQCRVVSNDLTPPAERVITIADLNDLIQKIDRFEKNAEDFLSVRITVEF